MKRFKSGSNLVFCTLALAVVTAFLAGSAAAARPGGERPLKEPGDPQRVVGVLHDQVEWWAREPNPIALAGEFSIDVETLESPEPGVDWRLVLTTLDREVVTSWSGYTPFRDGRGVAFVNFDGRDADGHPLPAGTYVYRFEAEGYDGSGGFLKVWASDAVPEPQVPDEAGHVFTPLSPSIPWNFYFGSHHNHSTYSDGGIPVATCNGAVESAHAGADPGAAYTYAKSTAGLDFLSLLDHNHIFDTACGTGCTTAQIRARYQAGLTAAANASDSTFVGIFGQEWGVISGGGHVALYEYTKLFGWDAFSDVITAKSDYPNLWNTIVNAAYQGSNGSMAGFCHPQSSDFGSYAQSANALASVRAIAVISGPATSKLETYADAGTRYSGPKAGTDRYQYLLQRGWKVGPEAHGDSHCLNYGTSTRNRTVVLATSLGKASVMDAMLNKRFYTSSDKNAQMFFGTADLTKVMGQTFTTASATLDLLAWISDPDGSAVSTATLYTGNPAAGTGSPTSAAMTNAGGGSYTATVTVPASGSAYYYVYATLANGGELFSSPIWVSKGGCSDTTAPTASVTAPTAATVTGTVAVTATGSDNVGVTGMTLAIDGSTVATSTTGSVSTSWNTSGLTAGSSHTITATATDACGNVSAVATKTVTIGGTVTYSISGSAGTSGATITAGSASATSDASNSYTVSGLAAGTWTVTPSKTGCTFSPVTQAVTITSASVTGVNFTASCTSGDVQLASGVAVTGQSVAKSAWKYYYIVVPSGATNLTLATTSATGDVDIYTQSGAKPTSSAYVCRPYGSTGNETCSATNPAAGTWWLGVYGYAAGSFTVTGTYTLGGTTYSISGSAGTPGATVSVGSASATSDASNNYTISGLATGTWTVTPTKSGCTFSPTSASVTISSANVTGKNFTASCGGGAVTLFSDGFENAGWSFANVSGTTGYWTLAASGTHPSVSPHGGTKLAAFNSYTAASGVQKRMYRTTGFAVAGSYTSVSLKFWMYHDTAYSSSADKVQAQVSTDGTTWTNVGSAISRYSSAAGWTQATIDLSAYKGQTVYLGFVGISGYGNDEHLDDVTVTAQ
jgi:hypothetical protein